MHVQSVSLSAADYRALNDLPGYDYETVRMDDGVTYLELDHKVHKDARLMIVRHADGYHLIGDYEDQLASGPTVEAVCTEFRRLLDE